MADFEFQETNRAKILRKLGCARLYIEGVIGEDGIFTYPSAFFLPLVFENSNHSFIELSDLTAVHFY